MKLLSTGLLLAGGLAWSDGQAKDAVSQQQLNYGYASLYGMAKGLRHSDKVFLFKFESEACQAAVKEMSAAMDRITEDLEKLARDDPRVKLDDDGMPLLENRKRDAVTRDRLLSFKPVTGRTGANFERTLLLSESGALNQMQHLVAVLDEADPDPKRSAVLKDIHASVARQYGQVVDLLNREYFK